MTYFFRLLNLPVDEKAQALSRAVGFLAAGNQQSEIVFERHVSSFSTIPGSPFAYWLGPKMRNLFVALSRFEEGARTAKIGASTKNNFRFLRLEWETDIIRLRTCEKHWVPFAKGGKRSPFYADIYLQINWKDNAKEIEAELLAKFPYLGSNAEFVLHRSHPHFRAGATWTLRAARFSPQFLPAGCVFSDRGYAAFVPDEDLAATIAVFNSAMYDYLFKVALGRHGFPEFIVGTLQSLPWKELGDSERGVLSALATKSWSLMRQLDTVTENSHAFVLPSFLSQKILGLDSTSIMHDLRTIQSKIDDEVYKFYEIDDDDRTNIDSRVSLVVSDDSTEPLEDEEGDETASTDEGVDECEAGPINSWLVGVAFGRFDPRLATGERTIPHEPEPFDPLPARSPGMWPEDESPEVAPPTIMVDDMGHPDDLCTHAADVALLVRVPEPQDLRAWLAKDFFPLHIKMYSKSRRKAPIYWQLATPSASYSVWLYIHAFNRDTFFRIQNDYVAPKLAHEERQLEMMTREQRDSSTPDQRKRRAEQETFVDELRTFLDEVKRVAPLWNPDLDDGVIINFAPLWRLVPHHKPWQKDLKSTWDDLCDGKYDWAHLAMHLWPERVVSKCATDRSLAIAHGLEDVFWMEGTEGKQAGKWTARETPTDDIASLVAARTSPAVKSALKSLLEAPAVAGKSTGRGRGRRKTTSSGDDM